MKILKYPFYTIAIDIGGTKICGALLYYNQKDIEPRIVYKKTVKAEAKKGAEVFINNICELAQKIKNVVDKDPQSKEINILSVGLGCAGLINKSTGNIDFTTDNFPGFIGTKLSQIVGFKTGLPTFVLNDVQSHTYGEARWGAGKNIDNFVLLGIGTGIGGAVVCDGKIIMGSHGYAGELGHIQNCYAAGIKCPCGKSGHLEAVSSGTAIENSYAKKTGKKLDGKQISDLANSGDKDAIFAIELAGKALGSSIAMLQTIYDPEIIVLCGSVVKSGKIWEKAVMDGFKLEIFPNLINNLNLVYAKLGDEAALFGASEYAIDRYLEL